MLTYADVGRTEGSLSDQMLAASGRAGPDTSGREMLFLEPYWKRPDAGGSASGQLKLLRLVVR